MSVRKMIVDLTFDFSQVWLISTLMRASAGWALWKGSTLQAIPSPSSRLGRTSFSQKKIETLTLIILKTKQLVSFLVM